MMFRSRLLLRFAVAGLTIAVPAVAADVPQLWPAIGDVRRFGIKGGRDHWEITRRVTTNLPASELSAALKLAYENAYERQGARRLGAFRVTASSPVSNVLEYDDGDGSHWKGILTVDAPTLSHGYTYTVRLITNRTKVH